MSNTIVNAIRWFCPTCSRVETRHPLVKKSEMPLFHFTGIDEKNTCTGSFVPQVFSPHSGDSGAWVVDVHSNLN
jgi:hypothetical protein